MTASPHTVRAFAAELKSAPPPAVDGEPVFAEPWEGRAYGLALELTERLDIPWSTFRDRLITAIGESPDRPYYESWVVALESLALDHGATTGDELRIERSEVGSYRYHEDDRDIEVTPLAADPLLVRSVLGEFVSGHVDRSAQIELYRVFEVDVPVRWGVRMFDASATATRDRPMAETEWEEARDRLLSFGR